MPGAGRELFGASVAESTISGARVYANGCAEAALACTPAIAVSMPPYFVVLSNVDPVATTAEEALQALIELVVDSLATR